MFIVVTEWDGEKPPTTYYKRLHQLGLYVRGDKEQSPLDRRSTESGSVIVQEGAIICASESLAREVAHLAEYHGAQVVQVGEVELENIRMTDSDMQAFQRIESIFGRRGRPPDDATDWVVTCLEEGKSYEVYDTIAVANCPACHGLRIKVRKGSLDRLRDPRSGDVFEDWVHTRFQHNTFEVPRLFYTDFDQYKDLPSASPVSVTDIVSKDEAEIVNKIAVSNQVLEYVEMTGNLSVFDNILAAQLTHDDADLISKRVAAVAKLYERGVESNQVSLRQDKNQYDLVDTAASVGARAARDMFLHYMTLKNGYS